MQKELQAHVALHVSDARPAGVLVVQPRNSDGTFRAPVLAGQVQATSFHVADYTRGGRWGKGRLA